MTRIALVVCLAALIAGGCGGGGPSRARAPAKLPGTLARTWAGQAEQIASAAGAGQSCQAQALAASLRNEVIRAGGKVPLRLRTALLDGVNSLADRIVCTPPPVTVTTAPSKPQKPPQKPKPPPPHHDHGHHHGHGGDQGNQG